MFFIVTIWINGAQRFEKETETLKPVYDTDVFYINVGGEGIRTTRQTLTKISNSTLSILFNGEWEHDLEQDEGQSIFFDFNPIVFRHLLDQLQIIESNDVIQLYPPFQRSLVEPFNKMIKKLGLQQSLSSEKQNVIIFNVGGQKITSQLTTLNQILLNSTLNRTLSPIKIMHSNDESDIFIDYDPNLFRKNIFGSSLPERKPPPPPPSPTTTIATTFKNFSIRKFYSVNHYAFVH